ncbi:unnamed protein product, partial [Brassica oleracea var. botrytis]
TGFWIAEPLITSQVIWLITLFISHMPATRRFSLAMALVSRSRTLVKDLSSGVLLLQGRTKDELYKW